MTGLRVPNSADADVREHCNVTERLSAMAALVPSQIAVACPHRRKGVNSYATITFEELDAEATRIARGLAAWGVPPGTRLTLLVRPGIEFVALVFGLLRAGMVTVLVDPGLGRRNLVRCLSEAEPEGFVAIGLVQAARVLWRHKFPRAKWNVTVGRRWGWGGVTLEELKSRGDVGWAPPTNSYLVGGAHPTLADDPAAIIFTSGSTGPPKGVLYTQRMFDTQVAEIQATYDIKRGRVDLACFPLFALFNAAMGVTTVFPKMDFSRPASANPRTLVATANLWRVTQAFASPAVWRVLGDYCARTGERIETLRQIFSCGAPVGADVLRKTLACVGSGAKMHTPYGATECLPVSTIEAAEVMGETAARTDAGAGVCVGRKFDSIEWRVIRITDEPIATIDETEELPLGEIGELIVRGPQASPAYVTSTEFNAETKIAEQRAATPLRGVPAPTPIESNIGVADDPARGRVNTQNSLWHRMGDVGYFDECGRFWYCGRKSQRVETGAGPLYTECVEAAINQNPDIERSALVGIGPRGDQVPVIAVQFKPHFVMTDSLHWEGFITCEEIAKATMPDGVEVKWMAVDDMPVDIRHNAKINRELLGRRAAQQFSK